MKQDHTEADIAHTDGEQNTGNHKKPATPETGGADRFGGTRAGAGNVDGSRTPGGAPPPDAPPAGD